MTSPCSASASTASWDSIQDDSIEICKAPAVLSWADDSNGLKSLIHEPLTHDHVTLDIPFDAVDNTAFFKITANVAYKGKRNKSNVFLHIYPESINTVEVGDDDGSAPAKLGTSVYTIHFDLKHPPALIIPKGDFVPKNDASTATLALLQDVATRTTLCIAFPSKILERTRLTNLCQEISSKKWSSKPWNATELSRLYGGKGGMLYETGPATATRTNGAAGTSGAAFLKPTADEGAGSSKSATEQQQSHESPPSYDALDVPPSDPASTMRKRRRLDSDSVGFNVETEKMSLEEICKRGFLEMSRRFERIERSLGDLSARLDRVEQLAASSRLQASSPSGQEAKQADDLMDRIDHIAERVTEVEHKLDDGLSDMARDVENQISDVTHEFNDTITVRVEDEMYAAQSQLEDFVKDEIRNAAYDVEEIVRGKMREALS